MSELVRLWPNFGLQPLILPFFDSVILNSIILTSSDTGIQESALPPVEPD
jgi:hypothetical protein